MKNLFSVIVLCLFSALTFQSILAQTGPSATPVTQWTNDAFEIRNPKGSLLLGSLDASYCHIYTDRPTFAFNKIILSIPGDFGSYYQSNLVFKTGVSYYNFNGNTRMTILNSNGNVGIGTTNPAEKLEVAGNIKATKFIGDGSGLTGITGGSSQWTTNGTSIYYNTGNIGIGTNNPTIWFSDKVMELYATRPVFKLNNTGGTSTIAFTNPTINATTHTGEFHLNYLFNSTSNDKSQLAFSAYPKQNIIVLSADGKVGIGAASVSEVLEVTGNVKATKFIGDGSGLTGITGTSQWSTSGTTINYSKGNVLIGKTTQTDGTFKLDVAGKIRANEIQVNTEGADFVFEPNYKLRTIAELEAFIKANKHLPEIAPAADMQTNGVNMGELQTKLLQKVEELTLYMIELKKENKELKAENAEIMKEIKELRKN